MYFQGLVVEGGGEKNGKEEIGGILIGNGGNVNFGTFGPVGKLGNGGNVTFGTFGPVGKLGNGGNFGCG